MDHTRQCHPANALPLAAVEFVGAIAEAYCRDVGATSISFIVILRVVVAAYYRANSFALCS